MSERQQFITLGCIGYIVTVEDGQVIFEERGGVFGCHAQFAFERPKEINDTPGIWYFVHLDTSSGRIPASHISHALQWCKEQFGDSFQPYKGALTP